MKTLFVLNDPPYRSERSYNGLRLAGALAKGVDNEVRVFLIGDAAACAKSGQKVPEGFYNIALMLDRISKRGGTIGVCSTCMDARGIADSELTPGTRRSTLDELAEWAIWNDKVSVF